jgi:hypothetical protein
MGDQSIKVELTWDEYNKAKARIFVLERDNADLARRIVNGASETIARELHVAELGTEVKQLREALSGIHTLAADDLNTGREGFYTSQIEADARAALRQKGAGDG